MLRGDIFHFHLISVRLSAGFIMMKMIMMIMIICMLWRALNFSLRHSDWPRMLSGFSNQLAPPVCLSKKLFRSRKLFPTEKDCFELRSNYNYNYNSSSNKTFIIIIIIKIITVATTATCSFHEEAETLWALYGSSETTKASKVCLANLLAPS